MSEKILEEAKKAFQQSNDASNENRKEALDDLKFAKLGEQWEKGAKEKREQDQRPTLTINKMPAFIREVVNDARQNKPQIKVNPVDDEADIKVADIYSGLIRNIERISNSDIAYDTAIDYAVTMGFGYIRIETDYAFNDSFEQDILIKRVANPFTVYEDPYAESADGSDWNFCFVTELVKKDEFKRRYPKAEITDFQGDCYDDKDTLWFEDDTIRVAEYWKREEIEDTLLLLSDGRKIYQSDLEEDEDLAILIEVEGIEVVNERPIKKRKVTQYIMTGAEVLEENEWPGIYIPIVPVYGEEFNVEGKRYFQSLIRQAKDSQRNFNYWRSAATELIALAPKAPFVGPTGAFKSDKGWVTANKENHPYLEYDGQIAPQRQPFAGMPAGALQESLNASDDIKAITGIYDASLGQRSNETSGVAIYQRNLQGDKSTFHFIDNLARSIRQVGRILVNIIPKIYDTQRVVRVLGEDGEASSEVINEKITTAEGYEIIQNNLSVGKYDLDVNAGPSFQTRRQETAYQMVEFIRSFPAAAPIIGDLFAKNLDWPGAEEIAERLKAVNPVLNQQQAAPPPPDPRVIREQQKMMIDKQKGQLDIAEKEVDLAIKQTDLEKSQVELEKEITEVGAGIVNNIDPYYYEN